MRRSPRSVRCVTLNLHGMSDAWREVRLPELVRQLKPLRPDIVCLQEATLRFLESEASQAEELAEALGMPFTVFSPYGNPLEIMSEEQGGIALLSRYPIVSARNRALPSARVDPPDARVAIVARIEVRRERVTVACTHLSWRPEESPVRLVQMGIVLQELAREGALDPGARTLIVGDLNAMEPEPVIRLLDERMIDSFRVANPDDPGFTDVRSNPLSQPLNLPDRRLDYIFCTKGARVSRARVLFDRPGRPCVSDHFGVLADISWRRRSDARSACKSARPPAESENDSSACASDAFVSPHSRARPRQRSPIRHRRHGKAA